MEDIIVLGVKLCCVRSGRVGKMCFDLVLNGLLCRLG